MNEEMVEEIAEERLKDVEVHKLLLKNRLNLPDYFRFGFEIEALIDDEKLKYDINNFNVDNIFNNRFTAVKEDTILYEINEYGGYEWSRGGEIITPILCDNEGTWQDIKLACEYLSKNARCTENCSIHTNIGAEALGSNYRNWYNFLRIIAACEPEIYRYFARGNKIRKCAISGTFRESYAMPVASQIKEGLKKCKENNVSDINILLNSCGFNGDYQQQKDKSVSLKGIYRTEDEIIAEETLDTPKYGNRIEFRMGNGTFKPEEIQSDVYVINRIIELSRNLTPEKEKKIDRLLQRELPENYNENLNISNVLDVANILFDSKKDKLYFLYLVSGKKILDTVLIDKNEILKLIRQDNMVLEFVGNQNSDREIVLEAVKHGGAQLKYASDSLKSDKEIVNIAVNNYGRALEHASEDLKGNREVVLAAVKNDGIALKYTDANLRADKEVVLAAVKNDGIALKYAEMHLRADREVVLEAAKSNGLSLEYASRELKGDKEVVLEAIKNNGFSLKCVSDELKGDKEVVLEAVKNDYFAFYFADETLKSDREFVLKLANENGNIINFANEEFLEDKEVVLTGTKTYPELFLSLRNLDAYREVVLEALKIDGGLMRYTHYKFEDDSEIILSAIKTSAQALSYASPSLKKDKEFILEAVKINGLALKYVNDSLKADKEVVLEAVKENIYALEYASDELQKDKEILLVVGKNNSGSGMEHLEYTMER